MIQTASRQRLSRRLFALRAASPLALVLAGLSPRQAQAARIERAIDLVHLHTGEALRTVYYADGRYLPEALRAAAYSLRDWRLDLIHPVDPGLLDLLWSLRQRLGTREPINVLCGYRSPATNAMLRQHSRLVARNSLHMQGMAIDICMPDRNLSALCATAISLKGGGVGYYPASGFVHVDTGSIRYW